MSTVAISQNTCAQNREIFIDRLVSELVDADVGIIRTLEEIRRQPGRPNFFHARATACDTSKFCEQRNFGEAGGASSDRSRAIRKAVGEAVERYCAAIYDVGTLPLESFANSERLCTDPSTYSLYSPKQYSNPNFPWSKFTRETKVRWTPAINATTGEKIFVPACRVFVPYTFFMACGDTPIDQPISTGLACHSSYEAAAISAICEVVERDAFAIFWQASMSPPRVTEDSLSDENLDLIERFRKSGYDVRVYDITMDHGIPTALSVLLSDRTHDAALVTAAAAFPDPDIAVRKSLEELAHTRHYCELIAALQSSNELPTPSARDVVDQITHLGFYVKKQNRVHADFLLKSDRICEMRGADVRVKIDESTMLRGVLERLSSIGLETYIADVTTSDIRELGLYVLRAIVPGLHPLRMGHAIRCLGGHRLWTLPQRMGYVGISKGFDNPAPHPYP